MPESIAHFTEMGYKVGLRLRESPSWLSLSMLSGREFSLVAT